MARKTRTIELTLSTEYAATWGLAEAFREFAQNGLDQERSSDDAAFTIRYDADMLTLEFANEKTTLDVTTLLIGMSSKREDEDTVGKYGEGYKLGMLAALRKGKSVEVRTGRERWRPMFKRSEVFNVPVLGIEISSGMAEVGATTFTISGVTAEEWEELRHLCLRTQNVFETIGVEYRRWSNESAKPALVLCDMSQKGRLYVGGLFVCTRDDITYGYDLPPAAIELDRDRRYVNDYSLKIVLSRLWQCVYVKASNDGDEARMEIARLVIGGVGLEAMGFDDDTDYVIDSDFRNRLHNWYRERHGDAHPVGSLQSAVAMQKLGRKHAMVPGRIAKMLARLYPSIEKLEEEQKQSVIESWSAVDLFPFEDEHKIVCKAEALIDKAMERLGYDQVDWKYATFNAEDVLGVYCEGVVYIARKLLTPDTFGLLIATMAHEAGHKSAPNHGMGLLTMIERILEMTMQLMHDEMFGREVKQPDEARESDEVLF